MGFAYLNSHFNSILEVADRINQLDYIMSGYINKLHNMKLYHFIIISRLNSKEIFVENSSFNYLLINIYIKKYFLEIFDCTLIIYFSIII